MIPPTKQGVTLPMPTDLAVETERLILRRWRDTDVTPNTEMLSDPDGARFITADGKPVVDEFVGWRNPAIMAGHWALHGFGLFVVEEKRTGRYVGRVGPWFPAGWPGFEVGWGIAKSFRGRGYAVEAATASIDWAFATFEVDKIVHLIRPENAASQKVAQRLGATIERQVELFGDAADLWVTRRDVWAARPRP